MCKQFHKAFDSYKLRLKSQLSSVTSSIKPTEETKNSVKKKPTKYERLF